MRLGMYKNDEARGERSSIAGYLHQPSDFFFFVDSIALETHIYVDVVVNCESTIVYPKVSCKINS